MKHQLSKRRNGRKLISLSMVIALTCPVNEAMAQEMAYVSVPIEDELSVQSSVKVQLKSYLKEVEQRLKVSFNYVDEVVDGVTLENPPMVKSEQGLHQLKTALRKKDLLFDKVEDKSYVIYKKEQRKETGSTQNSEGETPFKNEDISLLASKTAFGKNVVVMAVVKGTVTDETGEPLPGVNVIAKGTTSGAVTDGDGKYSLDVPDNVKTLVFSYIGYVTIEKPISGGTLNVQLQPDSESLDEVVVIGYGKQKKSDLTGSIASVDSKVITERSVTNALEGMQGNIAGVQISSSTGRVGDGFDITIRGNNSLSGSSGPLYIVDGVPMGDIDFLNPQDIQQMDVLKDASSTAIYGSRGSNGVVMITTKNGANAKTGFNVSYDSYIGWKTPARLPKMMDPQKWWLYHRSAYLATAKKDSNGIVTPELLEQAYLGSANSVLEQRANDNEAFDWYDAVLKTGFQHNNYLNINGTSAGGLGYNLGLGVQGETGNIDNESLDKYTFKLGLNHKLTDRFTAGANFTMVLTEQELGSDLAMREAFRLNPFLSPYGLDGELYPLPGKLLDADGNYLINKTSTYNPLLEIQNSINNIRRWTGVGNVFLSYQASDWLTFKTTYNASYDNSRQGRAWSAQTNTGVNNNDQALAYLSQGERYIYEWVNQFNIDKTFNEDHNVKFLGLYSLYSNRYENSFMESRYQPFFTSFYNIGSGEQGTFNLGSTYAEQSLISYAARLNYSFKDRYLLTLTNRWDGSSLLAEKWGSFPSAAVGWKISEESFMKNIEAISALKLRASYGFTGNNKVQPYGTLNALNQQVYYDFGGTPANGWLPNSLANTALRWEKTREFNVGIDFELYNGRIYGTVDVYDRLSDDLLMQQSLPKESGWSTITANVGSVSNKGVEVSLTGNIVQTKNVRWQTSVVFTKNTNQIVELYGQDQVDDIGNGWFIGESIDAQYNYQFAGIWQPGEEDEASGYGMNVGQEKLVDVNNDGKYDPNDDRIILGSENPDWTGSLTTRLNVGQFDLSASIITNQGVFVYSPFHENFTNVRDRGRQKLDIDWFIPENQAGLPTQLSNEYPQPRAEGSFWRNDGVGYYRDASFVKVKNISLGYTLPSELVGKWNLKKLRVYTNVLNPFVFSEYDGYDPEWASASLGIGRVSSITYMLGFNLTF